jgi:hypothetical protein
MSQVDIAKQRSLGPFFSGLVMGIAAPVMILSALVVRPVTGTSVQNALARDWIRVGSDMRMAIRKFRSPLESTSTAKNSDG